MTANFDLHLEDFLEDDWVDQDDTEIDDAEILMWCDLAEGVYTANPDQEEFHEAKTSLDGSQFPNSSRGLHDLVLFKREEKGITKQKSRCADDEDGEHERLKKFIESKKAASTVRKTEGVVQRFESWLVEKGEERKILDIPPSTLDTHIGSFLLDIRKGDLTEYEPDTLTSYHRSLERHLREQEYGYSLIQSDEFETSRKVLEAKRRDLKQQGKGNKPNRAEPLTVAEEEKLWERGQLGNHCADVLQNTLWYLLTKCLGFRAGDESRQLCWGDLTPCMDESGSYLQFEERKTKTRQGSGQHTRPFQPKVFENKENPERCPLRLYEEFRSHRPENMCEANSPFYLAINHKRRDGSQVWYKCQPLGEKILGTMVQRMCQKAGVTGHKTNQSIRKTMCTQLLHNNVPPTQVMQLSGHKNILSLNNYSVASRDQQRDMCDILLGVTNSKNSSTQAKPCRSTTPETVPGPSAVSPAPVPTLASQATVSTQPNSKPVSSLTMPSPDVVPAGLFAQANITGGTFNIKVEIQQGTPVRVRSAPLKFRRIIYDSSDSD